MPSKLEQLRKSILNMNKEEMLAMIGTVREDRKRSKAPIVKERKQADNSTKLVKMFEGLSDEDREALIQQLAASL